MDLLHQLIDLQGQFQHFADRHRWVRLFFPLFDGHPAGFQLGAPEGTPMPNIGVSGVAPTNSFIQKVLDHVQALTWQAEKLLLALLNKGVSVPNDIRREIEDRSRKSPGHGWFRWMMYATPLRSTCWFDNYSQAAATALEELKHLVMNRSKASAQRMSVDKANRKAMKLAEAESSFIHKTQREWSALIGCSNGLVSKLPFWQSVATKTGRARKGKPPRVVGLTDKLLASTPSREAELNRLVTEQKAEDEGSPLDLAKGLETERSARGYDAHLLTVAHEQESAAFRLVIPCFSKLTVSASL